MDHSVPKHLTLSASPDELVSLKRSRRIFLKDFNVSISMGIHDHEKEARQRVVVNVDLYIDPHGRIKQDSIRETVNYDFLRKAILELSDSGHFHLQETFCERILDICLDKKGVVAARVSSEKTDVYEDCASVGFEIFRAK